MGSVSTYVCDILQTFANDVLMIDSENGKTMTANQIIQQCRSISSYLTNCGVSTNDVIVYVSSNCAEYMSILLGIIHSGAAVAFGNPKFTEHEMLTFLSKVNPKCIIYQNSTSNLFKNVSDSIHLLSTNDLCSKSSTNPPNCRSEKIIFDKDHIAFIMLSSGTTGFPKPVMITHSSFITILKTSYNFEFDRKNQRFLAILPFFHIYGLQITLDCLCHGSLVISMANFNPTAYIQNIKKFQISYLAIVPSLFFPLVNTKVGFEDLKTLKLITAGGYPADPEMVTKLCNLFPSNALQIYNIYGMTEVTGIISCSKIIKTKNHLECIGQMPEDLETKIIDPQTGDILGVDRKGELCFKGERLFPGYLNNPSKTRNMIDEDGWLHTGDLVTCDTDGCYYYIDRIKDLIKYQGNQISPCEIEMVFRSHPEVEDVAVFGIPHNVFGELPAASVVLRAESTSTSEDLKYFVEGLLNATKKLRGGIFICGPNFIPKTVSGKVKRKELLRKLQEQFGHRF